MSETNGMLPPPPPVTPSSWTTDQFMRKETLSPALSVWLQVVLYVAAASSALSGIGILMAASAAERFFESDSYRNLDDWVAAEDFYATFLGLLYLVSIAVFVLLIVFLFRAHKACATIWSGPRKWSRGWTVGAWFIPFANAIITPMVWVETDRISSARRTDGQVAEDWRQLPINKQIVCWWVLYAVAYFGLLVGFGGMDTEEFGYSDYPNFARFTAVAAFLMGAALVLAALSVRRIGRALSPSSIG
jgi:hypothetical protein